MTNRWDRIVATALVVGIGALAAGCAASAFHMRAARTPAAFGQPPEGRAQVVFFLPARARDTIGIVDQRGTYYGQLRAETVLVVDVAPGRYRFYAIRERNGWAVDVPLIAAGQTAYVGGYDPLLTSFVWRSYTGCDADAVAARAGLASLAHVEPDPSVTQASVLAELGDIPRRTNEADGDLTAMSAEQRALRTVDLDTLARGGRCDASAPAGTGGDEAPPSEPAPPVGESVPPDEGAAS